MENFNGCKLGIYEKSLPAYLSFKDRLLIAKDAGYDFLEISIDETDMRMNRLDWSNNKRLGLMKAINYSDIPILTMCLSANRKYPIGSEKNEIRIKGIELIKKAVNFAIDIGIRILQIAGYDEYYNESNQNTNQLFYESLNEVVSYASHFGVMLALENVDKEFMNSLEKMNQCVNLIKSPFLQLYPDIGNLTAFGFNINQDTLNMNKNIVGFHLKDTKIGKIRNIPYGEGIVDFVDFFKTMINLNFSGFYMAEMWSTSDDEASIEYIKTARDFLVSKYREAVRQT